MYINDLIKIIIILSLIFTFIYLPLPFIKYLKITHMGEVLVDNIQREGAITEEIRRISDTLASKYNISPTVEYEGNFIDVNGEDRIQLKERFNIVINEKVKVFSFLPNLSDKLTYYINLSKKIVGVSHYYWREEELQ